jgi:hypothetical protein
MRIRNNSEGGRMQSFLSAPVVLLALCPVLLGYTAAPARSFAKLTADGRFVFVMLTPNFDANHAPAEEKDLRRKYATGGMYANDGTGRRLWAVDWYGDNVHPASDGVHVARVHDIRGHWLGGESRDAQLARVNQFEALALYAEGRLVRQYSLGELIDTSRFTHGQLNIWFRWLQKAELDEAAGTLTVEAITGQRVAVDYRSGEIISQEGASGADEEGWGWIAATAGIAVVAALGGVFLAVVFLLGRRPDSRGQKTIVLQQVRQNQPTNHPGDGAK